MNGFKNRLSYINKSLPDGYSNKPCAYFAICMRRRGASSMNKYTYVMLIPASISESNLFM